jgi:putative tryptophan/tyrosine transport system substrate-binding protein
MNRRGVLAMLGGTLFLGGTLVAKAQTATGVHRIGSLGLGVMPSPELLQRVWAPARELGWTEGQNVIVERRYAGGNAELLRPYAEELVRLNVEIILTNGTPAAIAARNATTRIPIVMISSGDPVRAGLVASLAKPGGNVTGYSLVSTELDGKRLALLHEVLPTVRRVGVLVNLANSTFEIGREENERVYRSLGVQPIIVDVKAASASEIENAVADAAQRGAQALDMPRDALLWPNRDVLMHAALRSRLPTFVAHRDMLEAGGFLCLAIDDDEIYRTLAYFLNKILRGAKPADLPVQQPTKFVLSINLKTARALGLTVPQSVLARADDVIQ